MSFRSIILSLLCLAIFITSCYKDDKSRSVNSGVEPDFELVHGALSSIQTLNIVYGKHITGKVSYFLVTTPQPITDAASFHKVVNDKKLNPIKTTISADNIDINNYFTIWSRTANTTYYCYLLWEDRSQVYNLTKTTNPEIAIETQKEYTHANGTNYLLHLPVGYNTSGKKWPVIVFAHGLNQASRNSAGKLTINTGPPRIAELDGHFPYIAFSANQDDGRSTNDINAALLSVLDQYKTFIDPKRIYLTGYSMGSSTIKNIGAANPSKYAALHTLAGQTDNTTLWVNAFGKNNINTWINVNQYDNRAGQEKLHNDISSVPGGNGVHKFTVLPGGHTSSIDEVFASPHLYSWLSQQRRP